LIASAADVHNRPDFVFTITGICIERNFEVRTLKITKPFKADVSFVVTNDQTSDSVHVYLGINNHHTMTASVSAGSSNAGLASGVAPNARVLIVRGYGPELRFSDFIEANLKAAARADVDILTTSFATGLLPDTQSDFSGLFFNRLVQVYNKPIFKGAGNVEQALTTATGDTFAVGGSISPATFAAMYGGGQLPNTLVHPVSAAGPGLDGAIKPDFLAPMSRVSGASCTTYGGSALPRNQPTTRLSPCYQVSCCTSASSPYAAGLAALLISAAKQERIDYSVANLGRALRTSARFIPDAPAYKQGNGLLDVEGAWHELQQDVINPRITITSVNQQPVSAYSEGRTTGPGLLEEEGWIVGSHGSRTFQLRREAGPSEPISYRLSWTGNDGTFSSATSILLPLNRTIPLAVSISPTTETVHSAILNVHDPKTNAILLRSMATVVVPKRLDGSTHIARFEGSVALLHVANAFWKVTPDTAAISVELKIKRGNLRAIIQPSVDSQYPHKFPASLRRTLTPGAYHFQLPEPSPGIWSLNLANDSAFREENRELISTGAADYEVIVRQLDVSLTVSSSLLIRNNGAELAEPQVKESWGRVTTTKSRFSSNGLAKPIEIEVPGNSSALIVNGEMLGDKTEGLDLYLYDCTTGECFSHDFALPSAHNQQLIVRNPYAGRWIAMVGTPSFLASGSFQIETITVAAQGSRTTSLEGSLKPEKTRSISLDPLGTPPTPDAVRVYELFDESLQRDLVHYPWLKKEDLQKLIGLPPALGMAIDTSFKK